MNTTSTPEATRESEPLGFAAGNYEMYARLFDRYASRVKGYMLRRGLSLAAAEELAQEVMLTVWHKAESYDPERAPVRTWVFTIARNRCNDQLRKQWRPAPDPADPCWVETLHVPRGPESSAMESGQEQTVREALRELDEEQRSVLVRMYFQGQTMSEVAASLNIPIGTVKSRARRALEVLRRRLRHGGLDGA